MALAVETEDLGIAAGPQDRLVQAHEGLLYMDFADDGGLRAHSTRAAAAAFCAHRSDAAAPSGGVHGDLRRRFEAGERRVPARSSRGSRELAERGREALLGGRADELGALMSRNFELRSQLVELEPAHVRMVELAGELGADANYAGSGRRDRRRRPAGRRGIERLREAFAAEGCALVAVDPAAIFPPGAGSSLRLRGDARRGAKEMPGDRAGGARVQLPALPRGDAAAVLAGPVRGRDQGHPPAARAAPGRPAATARQPDRAAVAHSTGAPRGVASRPCRVCSRSSTAARSALVTLQRPEKANALSIELRQQLGEAFSALDRDEAVGCVVLTGAGTRSAPGWTRTSSAATSTTAGAWSRPAPSPSRRSATAAARWSPPSTARRSPAASPLALLCDLRVASDRARFGYPELPRGIPPSYAAARAVLPATVAQELCLTGRVVQAQEAQRLGIVREVVAGDVLPRGLALAERIAGLPRRAILETKRRTMLERRHLWGFLFEEEERVFRRALLGDEATRAAPRPPARVRA